jgi:hypothetical protein
MKGKAVRPNLGYGTKEEKRSKKRQKLVEQLNRKREAQLSTPEHIEEAPFEDATVGREMYDILGMIQRTPIPSRVVKECQPDERQLRMNAIAQMQADLAHPAFFANPDAMFDATWDQLRAKANAHTSK